MASGKGLSSGLRGLLITIAIVALLVFVVAQFTTAQKLIKVLSDANWLLLLLAAAVHIVFFSLYAWMYHYGFEAVDVDIPTPSLVPVIFAAMFAKTIVPVEGAGFAAVLMADSARRGKSAAKAAGVTLLITAVDLASAFPFIVAGVILLRLRGVDAAYDYAAAGLFAAFVVIYIAIFWLGGVRTDLLRRMLAWVARVVDRLSRAVAHTEALGKEWAEKNARDFAEAWKAAVSRPGAVVKAAAVGTLLHVVNIVGLWLIFAAFGRPAGLPLLVTTYALSSAFYVVSVTPQGVGQVEAGTALVIESLGVPGQIAIAVTLVYRVMNVWLPVAIGLIPAQRISTEASDG